ncbi:MAG: class I SAM-dependent methyltransferase [Pseudomonadota bacterium]
MSRIQQRLRDVVNGYAKPAIVYRVESLEELEAAMTRTGHSFDLIYSQAAIEHIWHIEAFWAAMGRLTASGGWHSHRIDLADHGRRETNYIEMLEWSPLSYWLTMRLIPGAINRWRACHHLEKMTALGMRTLSKQRNQRGRLPIPLSQVSLEFRQLGADELRTTALDVVAVKEMS